MKIEYKIWEGPYAIPKKDLIELGLEGWELTGVLALTADRSHPRMYHYYFKRVPGPVIEINP